MTKIYPEITIKDWDQGINLYTVLRKEDILKF